MLKRTTQFLRTTPQSSDDTFPTLFVVLPLPCVDNSRYLTRERFLEIMESLGYSLRNSKESKRMAYWLFHYTATGIEEKTWKKKIIRDGGGRNNFAIAT